MVINHKQMHESNKSFGIAFYRKQVMFSDLPVAINLEGCDGHGGAAES